MQRLGVLAVLGLLSLAGGWQSPALASADSADRSSTYESAVGATADVESSVQPAWSPGVGSAERYARRRDGDVRFAVIDLEGRMHAFHAGRTAPAASVFKAMLLATYLRQSSVQDRALGPEDRRLLSPMIRRSDNETATRVTDIVGRKAIDRLARDAGMSRFRYHEVWGLSRTSANEQARFFYRFESFVPDRHEGYARKLLSSIVPSQRWGVGRVEPDGWELYFKGVWGSGTGPVNHQVAFLERHDDRIALAIFTEFSPSHAYGKQTLEGVAERLLHKLPRSPGA